MTAGPEHLQYDTVREGVTLMAQGSNLVDNILPIAVFSASLLARGPIW